MHICACAFLHFSVIMMSISLVSLFALLAAAGVCAAEEDTCSADGDASCHHRGISNSSRWQGYLDLIASSVANYGGCSGQRCGCHGDVIEKDLGVWHERGGIERAEFEQAKSGRLGVHYQIINHTLYREEQCMFSARCKGLEHFLLKVVDRLQDMEMIINVRDYPQSPVHRPPLPVFSFSKTPTNYDIMYPAWTFWSGGPAISTEPRGLGRWDLKRQSISKSGDEWPWEDKKNVAFIRGSRTSSERDPLVLLSRRRPDMVDAAYTRNQAWKSDQDTLGAPVADVVTLEDHCQFKYLFNFRGVAASFRFKHLFLCKSLVFHVGEQWLEFFYPALQPWVHYIPISEDLLAIEELLGFFQENDKVARDIALRGFLLVWDHLTMATVECYWQELLIEYAHLLNWPVQKDESLLAVL